jgi:hypothetical protein
MYNVREIEETSPCCPILGERKNRRNLMGTVRGTRQLHKSALRIFGVIYRYLENAAQSGHSRSGLSSPEQRRIEFRITAFRMYRYLWVHTHYSVFTIQYKSMNFVLL